MINNNDERIDRMRESINQQSIDNQRQSTINNQQLGQQSINQSIQLTNQQHDINSSTHH